VQMFFSRQYVRDTESGGVIFIHLDEDHLKTKYKGSLIATLDREHDTLPLKSGIGICSFAVHRNDYGHANYVNVGTSHVFVGDILAEIAQKGYYDHTHDLVMKTVVVSGMEPVKKGALEFRIDAVSFGPAIVVPNSSNRVCGSGIGGVLAEIETNVNSYIQACVDVESSIPDLFPNTERVRAPMDISEVGAEFTGGAFLPVAAYAMLETPPSNAEFFRNACDVVLARRGMTVADYHDFDDFEKSRLMGQVLVYAVQTFDYIGDGIELTNRRKGGGQRRKHVGTEEFSSIWKTLADDCEGGATGIYETRLALLGVKDFNPRTDKHLIELQAIARGDYFPLSTLAIVHGAKIGDQEGFGAHMYMLDLSNKQVSAALARTNEGRKLLQRREPATPPSYSFSGASSFSSGKNKTDRPNMFYEGTGIIDPIGHPEPLFDQHKYVSMNLQPVAHFHMRIPHDQYADSPFYLANMFSITDKFYKDDGINVFGLILGTVNPHYDPSDPENSHEMFRGHLYTDMLKSADNLAIIPHPPVPETTMAIIKDAIAFVNPTRPLVLDRSKPMAGKDRHPLWDKFVGAVASFKRKQGNKAKGSVDLIARPHQFDENLINVLIGKAAQLDRIWAADYVIERVTNAIYNYRVMLYVH
jgi:hypothetical protein